MLRSIVNSLFKNIFYQHNSNANIIENQLKPRPEFVDTRLVVWEELMAKYKADLAAKESNAIKVTLPDGKVMEGESWRTTPYNIAEKIR